MRRAETSAALRLNRFLARAGAGSRRGVEQAIRDGRVAINGRVVTALATLVDPRADVVTLDGGRCALPAAWTVLAFHKPLGVVSTLRAQGGQKALEEFRITASLPPGVVPVGRLDADSTGLLIWTDDGVLAQALMRPRHGVWKRYLVTLAGALDAAAAARVRGGGVLLDGRPCMPARLAAVAGGKGRRWRLELREGRNRQIRRLFAALGVEVTALHRTAVGPIALGRLAPGCFRRLSAVEQAALRSAAGIPAERGT